jgi:phage-related protein
VAAARLDNLAGSVDEMRGSAETLMITLGESLEPIVRKVVEAITGLLNQVTPIAAKFGELPVPIQAVAIVVGALALAIPAVALAIVPLLALLPAVAAGFGLVSASILPIAIVVGVVVAAIAGVVAAYVLWQTKGDEIRAAIDEFVASVGAAFDRLKETTVGKIEEIADGISGGVSGWAADVKAQNDAMNAAQAESWEQQRAAISDKVQEIADNLSAAWTAINENVSALVSGLIAGVSGLWSSFQSQLAGLVQSIADNLSATWTLIANVVSDTVAALINWLSTNFGKLGQWLAGWLNKISGAFGKAWDWIRSTVGTLAANLANAVVRVLHKMGAGVAKILDLLGDAMLKAWNAIKDIVKRVATPLVQGVANTWSKIVDVIAKALGAAEGIVGKIMAAIAKKIMDIGAALGPVGGAITAIGQNIMNAANEGLKGLSGMISGALSRIRAGIGDVGAAFGGAIGDVRDRVASMFAGTPEDYADEGRRYGRAVGDAAVEGAADALGAGGMGLPMPGGGGGAGGAAAAAEIVPGMTGKDSKGEFYYDELGQKVYTSGVGLAAQRAKAEKAALSAAKKAAATPKDTAASAAKTMADVAEQVTQSIAKAMESLRALAKGTIPGREVWEPRLAAIGDFIAAVISRFDTMAKQYLQHIATAEDGSEIVKTAQAQAMTTVSSIVAGFVDALSKVSTFLQSLVKAKFPEQGAIDAAFSVLSSVMARIRDQAVALAESIGGQGQPTTEALAGVGQVMNVWADAFGKIVSGALALGAGAGQLAAVPASLDIVETVINHIRDVGGRLVIALRDAIPEDQREAILALSRDVAQTISAWAKSFSDIATLNIDTAARVTVDKLGAAAYNAQIMVSLARELSGQIIRMSEGVRAEFAPAAKEFLDAVKTGREILMMGIIDLSKAVDVGPAEIGKAVRNAQIAFGLARDLAGTVSRMAEDARGDLVPALTQYSQAVKAGVEILLAGATLDLSKAVALDSATMQRVADNAGALFDRARELAQRLDGLSAEVSADVVARMTKLRDGTIAALDLMTKTAAIATDWARVSRIPADKLQVVADNVVALVRAVQEIIDHLTGVSISSIRGAVPGPGAGAQGVGGIVERLSLGIDLEAIKSFATTAKGAVDLMADAAGVTKDWAQVTRLTIETIQTITSNLGDMLVAISAQARKWAQTDQATEEAKAALTAFVASAKSALDIFGGAVKVFADLEVGASIFVARGAIELIGNQLRALLGMMVEVAQGFEPAAVDAAAKVAQALAPILDIVGKVGGAINTIIDTAFYSLSKATGGAQSSADYGSSAGFQRFRARFVFALQSAIQSIVNALSGVTIPAGINTAALDAIASVVERYAALIERINQVKVDPQNLEAFVGAVRQLSGLFPAERGSGDIVGGGGAGARSGRIGGGGGLPGAGELLPAPPVRPGVPPPPPRILPPVPEPPSPPGLTTIYHYGPNNFFDVKDQKGLLAALGAAGFS